MPPPPRIRIIRHKAVKDTGSFEVRFAISPGIEVLLLRQRHGAALKAGDPLQRTGIGAG
jgi:hypothetical protein